MSESYSLTTLERLNEILESIQLIKEWSCNINNPDDFLSSSNNVMAFNACVMRLQVIGENVGKLLKKESDLLSSYTNINKFLRSLSCYFDFNIILNVA